MTGLSGTTDFLEHLAILYDTFGITCKASTSEPITPEQVIQNLNTVVVEVVETLLKCQKPSSQGTNPLLIWGHQLGENIQTKYSSR